MTFIGKKKLTAYQKHVKKERLAGKSMKEAAASWRLKKGDVKAPSKKRKKPVAKKKKKGGKRGSRLLGNIGLKGALIGGTMLVGANLLVPNIGGQYAPAVKKVAAGMAAKAIGVTGASLAGAGLIEAAAIAIANVISGQGFGVGGAGSQGGTDY